MVFCIYSLSPHPCCFCTSSNTTLPQTIPFLLYFFLYFLLAYYFHFIIIIYILSCLSTPPFLFSIFHGTLLLLTVFIVCMYVCVYMYVSCYVLSLYIAAFSSLSISDFDLHCSHVFSPQKICNLQPFWGHKMPPYYTTLICLLLNTLQPFYGTRDSLTPLPFIHSSNDTLQPLFRTRDAINLFHSYSFLQHNFLPTLSYINGKFSSLFIYPN